MPTRPTPSPAAHPAPETDDTAPETEVAADPDVEADAQPLNRAARRAKGKHTEPTHVGPRAGRLDPARAGRGHSTRAV